MPHVYPVEVRARAIVLVRAGKSQKQTAKDFWIHPVKLSKWMSRKTFDRGVCRCPDEPTSGIGRDAATNPRTGN